MRVISILHFTAIPFCFVLFVMAWVLSRWVEVGAIGAASVHTSRECRSSLGSQNLLPDQMASLRTTTFATALSHPRRVSTSFVSFLMLLCGLFRP